LLMREDRRSLMPTHLLQMLPAFLAYFAVAIVLLALFLLVYLNVTPYGEITLIRQATRRLRSVSRARCSVLPCRSPTSSRTAIRLIDLAAGARWPGWSRFWRTWSMRFALPRLAQDIPAGKVASATFLAALSLSVGLINAACMTY
jgi:putative membrane protein